MKKVLVLLLAMVAVGSFVFAEDAPAPTYEFSANATGGWKYDIDAGQSTFINDWDFSLKYHLLNDVAKSKGAEEGTYGLIEVTHINLNLIEETEGNGNDSSAWGDGAGDGTGDNLGISAKIVSGPIEVGLYGAPGNNYENAKFVPLFEKDKGWNEATYGVNAAKTRDSAFKPELARDKGLSLKYTFGTFGYVQVNAQNTKFAKETAATADTYEIVVGTGTETVATNVTYNRVDTGALDVAPLVAGVAYVKTTAHPLVAASDPKYLIGANLQIKPVASDSLTVTIDGGMLMNTDTKDMIMTAKAAVAAGSLSASAALDGGKAGASGSVFQWDAAANVAYALFEKKDSINLDFYAANMTDDSADMATDLGLKYVDAEGLVPGLSFTVGMFWFDLLNNLEFDPKTIAVAESVSYKYMLSDANYVKPYQALRYDLNDVLGQTNPFGAGTGDDSVMYLNLGVEAQFFPNCVFTVDYFKGNKMADNNANLVKNKDASEFSIKAKVSL